MACPSAPHEQGIAQAVQIADPVGVRLRGQADTLRATADGPADVQFGVNARTSRQNERSESRQLFVHPVDFTLELFAVGDGDAGLFRMDIFRQGGKQGAQIEKLMLHALQNFGKFRQVP